MTVSNGFVVPTNAIRAGENTMVKTFTAESAIVPGSPVKYGSSVAEVVPCGTADTDCIGIADANFRARGLDASVDPMTENYAAEDQVDVIQNGYVRVVADTAGFTAGKTVACGAANGAEVDDSIVAEQFIGRAMTTAASGVAGVIKLNI